MKKIALLACSKSKKGKDQLEELFRAEDIYTGNSFRKSLDKVRKEDFDDYFIISAKHYLLKKDQIISYYDKTLHKMSAKECKEWAEIVYSQLKKELVNLDEIEFYIFGGEKYYENLLCKLKKCTVYTYHNSNSINLSEPKHYENGKLIESSSKTYKVEKKEEIQPIQASLLRIKENLKRISDKPGYYKWWAKKEDVEILLEKLDVDITFEDIESDIEKKEDMDLYCIYIGIAEKESIRNRLNWHVNQGHKFSAIKSGYLSTLRQSLSSLLSHNQKDEEVTNQFIDKLYIEYFEITEEAEGELRKIEKEAMEKYLYILNIQGNHHPKVGEIKKKLKELRKAGKEKALQI